MRLIMWIFALFCSFTIFFGGGTSLKLTGLMVPSHANLGDSVSMRCVFDLEGGHLYSVKWYKDDFEFYRYMPDNEPRTQVFSLAGIHLDVSSSDMNQVTLNQVGYMSSGSFRCEVSTEAPNFETSLRSANMTVLAYPDSEPQISGVSNHYSINDYVTGNCTSGKSNPAPRLVWFINGIKAESWLLDKYPLEEHPGPLYSRSLGLRFQIDREHGHSIALSCTVSVADLPPQSSHVSVRLSSTSDNQGLFQERFLNSGGERCSSVFFLCLFAFMVS